MGKTDRILYYLLMAGFVFIIYKYGYAHTNNADKYMSTYLKKMKRIDVNVPDTFIPGFTIKRHIFKRGFSLLGFKGLSGHIYNHTFYSDTYKKYLKIYMFDATAERTSILSTVLDGKDLLIDVNSDDLKNPNYGTKENPIPVFNFKGAKEPLEITSSDAKGNDIMENIETTKEEFRYNVKTYLTYIMPGKEFKERFEKSQVYNLQE